MPAADAARRSWVNSTGPAIASVLIPALVGTSACGVAIAVSDSLSVRRIAIIGLALTGGLIAMRLGRFRDLCLALWVMIIPYPRTYYLDSGVHGFHGPYLVASDALLLLLYGFWWFDTAVRKQPKSAQAGLWWPWLGPFAVACALSVIEARRADWAAFELIRIIRLGLILLYLRFNLSQRNLLIVAVAALLSLAGECAMGLLQVTTRRFATQVLAGEEYVRAVGWLIHPNMLAAFLLLQLPLVMALAASRRVRWQSQICWLVAALCVAALGATLSRAAWFLTAAELSAMAVVLMGLRLVRPQAVIGAGVFGLLVLAAMVIPLRDKIERRITGNLRGSIDTRQELNRLAVQIWKENPAFGTGLNNFEDSLQRVAPEWDEEQILAGTKMDRTQRLLRWRLLVHNLWLLILAESGWLGLSTFVWLLFGILWRSLRLLGHRYVRAQALGAAAATGLLAVCTQQFVEFTLWTDSILLTFALFAGIVAALPVLVGDNGTLSTRYS